jgi:UPF0755 protein
VTRGERDYPATVGIPGPLGTPGPVGTPGTLGTPATLDARGPQDHFADADTGSFVFGLDDDSDASPDPQVLSRAERTRQRKQRQGRSRMLLMLIAGFAVVVVAAAIFGIPKLVDALSGAKDYSGSGSGSVTVSIPSGASASQIAGILHSDGVVASSAAFTDAANANAQSKNIQPGSYVLKQHMSAKLAVLALLDPASRNANADVVITEGATILDVESRLEKVLGTSQHQAIVAAAGKASELGLPVNYGKLPNSPEGFLYPATYTFDPGTSAESALQKMVSRFIEQDRTSGFATAAKKLGVTPYEALIVASIAQAEAKFPADMPKVARVIYNRLKAGMPLQIDATSAYAGKLQGLDPAKVIYAQINSPYNTYQNSGLPPTPIGNPGASAMDAAVNPAAGNWLYYVNGDKAGNLAFFHAAVAFAKAVATCRANNWGCG